MELAGRRPAKESMGSMPCLCHYHPSQIRQLEDALEKLGVTVATCEVDGTNQMPLRLE